MRRRRREQRVRVIRSIAESTQSEKAASRAPALASCVDDRRRWRRRIRRRCGARFADPPADVVGRDTTDRAVLLGRRGSSPPVGDVDAGLGAPRPSRRSRSGYAASARCPPIVEMAERLGVLARRRAPGEYRRHEIDVPHGMQVGVQRSPRSVWDVTEVGDRGAVAALCRCRSRGAAGAGRRRGARGNAARGRAPRPTRASAGPRAGARGPA